MNEPLADTPLAALLTPENDVPPSAWNRKSVEAVEAIKSAKKAAARRVFRRCVIAVPPEGRRIRKAPFQTSNGKNAGEREWFPLLGSNQYT
jgi:hypothetical protein